MALLAGCSNQTEKDAAAAEKAAEAKAQDEKIESGLSKGLADLTKSVDSKLEDQKAEMEAKLKEQEANANAQLEAQKAELQAEFNQQKEALLAQFSEQTSGLKDQFEGFKSQYSKVKSALSDETVQSLDSTIPAIDLSIENLTKIANKYSPETMAQLESFKQEYASEFETAQKLIKDGLAALKSANIKMPSF